MSPAAAEDIARRLHEVPAAILVGWGMARRVNGGAIVRALDALCAISGNLGVPGGGVSYYFKRRKTFDHTFIRGIAAAPRTVAAPTSLITKRRSSVPLALLLCAPEGGSASPPLVATSR